MTDNTDTDEGLKPYRKPFFSKSSVAPIEDEELILAEEPVIEVVEEPVIEVVEEPVVVAPVDSRSEAEKETALAWEMVEKMRAKEAAKKTASSGEDVSAAKVAANVERKAALAKKLEELYTVNVGAWNGLDNYECVVCPYATLDVELIKIHVKQHV